MRDVKLRGLQTRVLYRIIATNITLEEMGVVDDTRCIVCHNERDSIDHVFWKCDRIRQVWKKKAIQIIERQM